MFARANASSEKDPFLHLDPLVTLNELIVQSNLRLTARENLDQRIMVLPPFSRLYLLAFVVSFVFGKLKSAEKKGKITD